MRYYNVIVSGAPSVFPARYDNGAQWGTTLNGVNDPNAQQVEFQIVALDAKTPTDNSTMTIYGVSWDQILASNQLVGKPIRIDGGMWPGLPLATFQGRNRGRLIDATILKCWGNWIGNEMSIGMAFAPAGIGGDSGGGGDGGGGGGGDGGGGGGGDGASTQSVMSARYNRTGSRSISRMPFPTGRPAVETRVFSPLGLNPTGVLQQLAGQLISDFSIGPATSQFGSIISSFFGGGNMSPLSEPLNLIHNLMPNMPLSSAIQQTLSTAFPNANINVAISNMLKLAYQDAGIYQALEQYAGYINNLSQSIFGTSGGKYPGIQMTSVANNTLDVWDGSSSLGNFTIDYKDLIGQPTWTEINMVHVKVALRGGLKPGDVITLPDTVVNFAEGAFAPGTPSQKSHVSLPGSYQIFRIMHIGDFRNPDGSSWSTNIEAQSLGSVNAAAPPPPDPSLPQRSPSDVSITIRPIPGQ